MAESFSMELPAKEMGVHENGPSTNKNLVVRKTDLESPSVEDHGFKRKPPWERN